MEPSGPSCPARIGSLTGQGQRHHLWDEIEDHRDHQALPLPKLVPLFLSGTPQALSLTLGTLVTGTAPRPLPFPPPPLLGSFPQKSGCAAGNNFFGSLLSYSIPKQAHRASFSLQRFTANSEAKQSGSDEINNRRKGGVWAAFLHSFIVTVLARPGLMLLLP